MRFLAVLLVALAILAFETALALRAGGLGRRRTTPAVAAIAVALTTGVILLLIA